MRRAIRLGSCWGLAFFFCIFSGALPFAGADDPQPGGDDETPPVRLHGATGLTPPEGSADEDATGSVRLRQKGDRLAIHVLVRHLEPGATYEVLAEKTTPPGGEEGEATTETASLGTITTRDGTPPPPWCFRANLSAPAPEEPPGEGGCWDHFGPGHDGPPLRPHTFVILYRNREQTELRYEFHLRGIVGTVKEASLDLGNGTVLPLPLDEELRGSVAIDEAALTALASGSAVVTVRTLVKNEADEKVPGDDLTGKVKSCFPFLDDFRERMAKRLGGTGALRLDTGRGDKMPFEIASLTEFVGIKFLVQDASKNTVLEGTIEEVKECNPPVAPPPPEGGGAALTAEEEETLALSDDATFFGLLEPHDASFVRGDANDDGRLNMSDPVFVLQYLFQGTGGPYCADAADADDNGALDIADPILMLGCLFQGQGTLLPPYPERGFDRTVDKLSCQ